MPRRRLPHLLMGCVLAVGVLIGTACDKGKEAVICGPDSLRLQSLQDLELVKSKSAHEVFGRFDEQARNEEAFRSLLKMLPEEAVVATERGACGVQTVNAALRHDYNYYLKYQHQTFLVNLNYELRGEKYTWIGLYINPLTTKSS